MVYFWGWGRVQKLFWGVLLQTNNFCFHSIALFLLYHVVGSFEFVVGGGGSQRLLSPNPTTVMVDGCFVDGVVLVVGL